eukprot:scaffold177055_cov29-Prasinocladus_malaysianus.AAC.1
MIRALRAACSLDDSDDLLNDLDKGSVLVGGLAHEGAGAVHGGLERPEDARVPPAGHHQRLAQ